MWILKPDVGFFIGNFETDDDSKGQAMITAWQTSTIVALSSKSHLTGTYGINKNIAAGASAVQNESEGGPKFSLRDVNKSGGNNNCVSCAIATDNYLKGRPTSALNSELTSKPTSLSVIESEYNGKFVHGLSIEKIKGMVSSSGETGIVFGNRGPGKVGHVFNVINQNGKINFVDGQTGKGAALSGQGYKDFSFIPTNNK